MMHLNTVASGGSIPSVIRLLVENAAGHGFAPEIIFGRGPAAPALPCERVGSLPGQALDLALSRLFDAAGRASWGAARTALKAVQRRSPALVHIHNIHGYWMNHRMLLEGLSAAGIPAVWTLHDYWPMTGHCAYFEPVGCDKWRTGCGGCPQIREYPKSFIDRSATNFEHKRAVYEQLRNVRLITVSDHSTALVGESMLGRLPATRIYNSVATSVFRPTEPAVRFDGKTVVGCVARRWDTRKGLADVLELRRRLDDSYLILIVGLDQDRIRGLPEGMTGFPATDTPAELARLYCSMDVFFNPSHAETFGMTTVEAMACGVPTVVYDVSANAEIQPDFLAHCLVPEGDIPAAAAAIETLGREARQSLADALVGFVERRFSPETFVSEHYRVYREMLTGNGIGRGIAGGDGYHSSSA
ncbi:MAG: glycosyltransferase [Gammaproteobacteria bacterium]